MTVLRRARNNFVLTTLDFDCVQNLSVGLGDQRQGGSWKSVIVLCLLMDQAAFSSRNVGPTAENAFTILKLCTCSGLS